MNILVLGAGLVGAPMAMDLAADNTFQVTVADKSEAALERLQASANITPRIADLSDKKAVAKLVASAELVINAVPGFMGFATLQTCIEAGKNVVDIAFFAEDPFELDALARDNGVTAVIDCGVAPGMSNMLVGLCHSRLDHSHAARIFVGGLPEIRTWPYEYKAVFSPIDVIEEYTRPAVYVENGQQVVRPALSDPEQMDFPGIGTLEAFNTDGLRTLAQNLPIANMKEKTLRYPGHIEKMVMLRESGFFDTEPVVINGTPVRPIDLTAKLLFPMWQLKPGEVDITVMRIEVEGEKDGEPTRITWELNDRYNEKSGIHSMARTTGYTATMVARLLAEGEFEKKGIIAPEIIGADERCMKFILQGLADRGVVYKESVEKS